MAEHRIRDRRPNLFRALGVGASLLSGGSLLGMRSIGTILGFAGTRRGQEDIDEHQEQQEAEADRLNV